MAEDCSLHWHSKGRHILYDDATGGWRLLDGDSLPDRPLTFLGAYGDTDTHNLLIRGDNLYALRALLPELDGRVGFVYVDPPFNTGRSLTQYKDSLDHGLWLSMFSERAGMAKELLRQGGAFAVHLNVVEQPYARLILDGLYGRENLVSQISWQRAPDRTLLGQGQTRINDCLEYVLVYSKGKLRDDLGPIFREVPLSWKTLRSYSRLLKFSWERQKVSGFVDNAGNSVTIYRHDWFSMEPVGMENLRKAYCQSWRALAPLFPGLSRLSNQQQESTFQRELLSHATERDRLYSADFVQPKGKHKGQRTRYYLNGQVVLFLKDTADLRGNAAVRTADLNNLWTDDEISATGIAREGNAAFKRGKKPELLLHRLLSLFTREQDLVVDFFAGSGTTGAVAHKMGRRWIMVEAKDETFEICKHRMEAVVDGRDPAGVTRLAGWTGGGGFQVMRV